MADMSNENNEEKAIDPTSPYHELSIEEMIAPTKPGIFPLFAIRQVEDNMIALGQRQSQSSTPSKTNI